MKKTQTTNAANTIATRLHPLRLDLLSSQERAQLPSVMLHMAHVVERQFGADHGFQPRKSARPAHCRFTLTASVARSTRRGFRTSIHRLGSSRGCLSPTESSVRRFAELKRFQNLQGRDHTTQKKFEFLRESKNRRFGFSSGFVRRHVRVFSRLRVSTKSGEVHTPHAVLHTHALKGIP